MVLQGTMTRSPPSLKRLPSRPHRPRTSDLFVLMAWWVNRCLSRAVPMATRSDLWRWMRFARTCGGSEVRSRPMGFWNIEFKEVVEVVPILSNAEVGCFRLWRPGFRMECL